MPSGLVTSGVVELAAGALSGWVFAAVRYDGDGARKLRIKSPARIRQWHLDLIALGTGTVALGLAVPNAPKGIQRALAGGAWTNAMMFLPLAYRPELLAAPDVPGAWIRVVHLDVGRLHRDGGQRCVPPARRPSLITVRPIASVSLSS